MDISTSNYARFKKQGVVPDIYVQLDVKSEGAEFTICNLYTGINCIEISMRTAEYHELTNKGFFIRDGKDLDSAGVLNTTDTFIRKKDLEPNK